MAPCEVCSSTKEKLFGIIFVCPRCDRRASKKSIALNTFMLDNRILVKNMADVLGVAYQTIVEAVKGKLLDNDPFWKEMEFTYSSDWLKYLKEKQ